MLDLSIIIPLLNEEESLSELNSWIYKVITPLNINFEIIYIDDGSSDSSWKVIKDLSENHKEINAIRFRRNFGKSAAINCGFEQAKGNVVITMDADLQDSPDEIPELLRMVKDDNWDMVSGWKKKRFDPLGKTIPSKLFNRTARMVSGIKLHDFNCGLKAYNSEVVKNIEVYGEMHRYIPILAKQAGFNRIGEKVVHHQERKYGKTKYGIERFLKGYLDLLSVMFISKFGNRPMHLFGALGTLMFMVGFFSALWLGLRKLYFVKIGIVAPLVVNSPYFHISLASMVIGTQLFMTGFIAELISRTKSDRNKYQIKEEIKNDVL